MQIINLGADYATITGGFLKKGATTEIADWEYPIMLGLGAKIERIDEAKKEEVKTVKKKKK